MKARALGFMAVVTLAAAGCGGAPAPVPVTGAPADLRHLAGEWNGEYQNETNGRAGSIVFKFAAGADTAYGDVVMIPRERGPRQLPAQDPSVGLPIARTPQILSIAFVRAEGGGLSGQLVPYQDPECGCLAITRFEGRIRGATIEGTFSSRHPDGGGTQKGTWKVRRSTAGP